MANKCDICGREQNAQTGRQITRYGQYRACDLCVLVAVRVLYSAVTSVPYPPGASS